MTKWPTIRCAVCDKPVEYLVWFEDYGRAERVLRVHCHGAVDEMRFDPAKLTRAELQEMEFGTGVAFATPALAVTPPSARLNTPPQPRRPK